MSWKDSFSFIAPEGVDHPVQGKVFTFYPISVKTAWSIRSTAQSLMQALSTLLTKRDGDRAESQKTQKKQGLETQDIHIDAIDKELAELRTKEREKAVGDAIRSLLDPDNSLVIGMLLVDSLRDVFSGQQLSKDEIKRFVDEMPLPAMSDMLVGLAKGNKSVFGPLAGKAEGLLKRGLAAVSGEQETIGEDSKTQS